MKESPAISDRAHSDYSAWFTPAWFTVSEFAGISVAAYSMKFTVRVRQVATGFATITDARIRIHGIGAQGGGGLTIIIEVLTEGALYVLPRWPKSIAPLCMQVSDLRRSDASVVAKRQLVFLGYFFRRRI